MCHTWRVLAEALRRGEPSITAAWQGCLGSEQEAAGGNAFCRVCVSNQWECVGQSQDWTEASSSRSPMGMGRLLVAVTVALLPLDVSGLLLHPARQAGCSVQFLAADVNHCQVIPH